HRRGLPARAAAHPPPPARLSGLRLQRPAARAEHGERGERAAAAAGGDGRGVTVDDPSPARAGDSRATPLPAAVVAEITLANPNGYPEVSRRELRPWLAAVLRQLAPAADSFAVRFTSDREMHRLNRDFRGKDKTT